MQLKLYNEILRQGLSVRRVEELAKVYQLSESTPKTNKTKLGSNRDFESLRKHLSTTFNTPVQFACDNSGKGKITFPFKNQDELAKLITIFDSLKSKQQ